MFLNEPKETKCKQLPIMVTPTQHQIIKRMAAERDMKMSEMIMQLLEMEYLNPVLKFEKKQVQEKLF